MVTKTSGVTCGTSANRIVVWSNRLSCWRSTAGAMSAVPRIMPNATNTNRMVLRARWTG